MKFQHASQAFKKLNPSHFGMGQFQPKIAQPNQGPALEPQPHGKQTRNAGMVGSHPQFRVALTNYRRKLLDSDNYIGGMKPLRDAVATRLGIDDADRFIEWEYSQVVTRGIEGTAVRIEKL